MYDRATTVIDRIGLCEHRQALMDKIRSHFDIPSTGVVFVLEREDYRNYRNYIWRSTAVHLNIEVGGVEEMSPQYLLDLMKSQDYSNLIWLSKKACEARDICFAWVLAHELRHFEQDLCSHTLSKAGHFLLRTLGTINIEELNTQNTVPTELDADLKAWRVIRKLFGVEVADSYVRNESAAGKHQQPFRILISHDPEKTYDVFGYTVSLLQKYQSQLKGLQKHSEDNFIATFDIDMTCSELNRHEPGFDTEHDQAE